MIDSNAKTRDQDSEQLVTYISPLLLALDVMEKERKLEKTHLEKYQNTNLRLRFFRRRSHLRNPRRYLFRLG